MNIENEIMSYLFEYGNTRESDIIHYGVKRFHYSPKGMKKVIKRMAIKGKIHYVVHNRLDPVRVYISLKEPLPPETEKILLEAYHQMKAVEEDVQSILEEAETVADQKRK